MAKKVMVIGKVGCGKTTLCQQLNKEQVQYKKTQAVEIVGKTIDTPGEYVERKRFYQALLVTSADADCILMLQDATDGQCAYSPGMYGMFQKQLIGVVTKIDLAEDEEQIRQAEEYLELAGAKPIYRVCSLNQEGIEALVNYLEEE